MIQFIKQCRTRLLAWSIHQLALPVIRLLCRIDKFPFTEHDLRKMEPGTLGALLLAFWDRHDLGLLKYYEGHDIKHAILGYPADDRGEACLQYFLLGNGYRSFPVLISAAISFFIMPEFHRDMRIAYIRGKQTPSLVGVNWLGLLSTPAVAVIEQLRIAPAKIRQPKFRGKHLPQLNWLRLWWWAVRANVAR